MSWKVAGGRHEASPKPGRSRHTIPEVSPIVDTRMRIASPSPVRLAGRGPHSRLPVIEGWYNPARRHSGLGYPLPIAYEEMMQAEP